MIFVTVGTWKFDRLVETIDRAAADGRFTEPILVQIGVGEYTPLHCEYFRTAPSLAPYYEKASLVVAHGGSGSTLEVLERGLPLVSVCNPTMQDNHQHEFLEMLERYGYTAYCRDIASLPDVIRRVLSGGPPAGRAAEMAAFVTAAIEGCHPRQRRGPSWRRLRGWLSRRIQRYAMPVERLQRIPETAQRGAPRCAAVSADHFVAESR